MTFLTAFFENDPAKTFAYLLVIISIITIVIVSFSFYYDFLRKKDLLKKMSLFERSLKDLVEEFRSFELLFTEQKKTLEEYKYVLNDMQQEISRLADSLKSEKNITSAISLAKEGFSVQEISEKTGIPAQEVEPIVRYHGKS